MRSTSHRKLLIVVIVCVFFVGGLGYFVSGLFNVRTHVHAARFAGLQIRSALLEGRDIERTAQLLSLTAEEFSAAESALMRSSALKIVPGFGQQWSAIYETLRAATIASSALADAAKIVADMYEPFKRLGHLEVGQLTVDDRKNMLAQLQAAPAKFKKVQNQLANAQKIIDETPRVTILPSLGNEIAALTETLALGNEFIDDTIPLVTLAPFFAGYPDPATYLLILQNSDEMRPTGGFIGTYGILTIDAGHITGFSTDDSYNLDRRIPAFTRSASPKPIAHYLGQPRFYFRDANWNPDFKESAERLLRFYKEEGRIGNPSGVLAIMPGAIKPLLKLIGPITVQGQTFTAENFTDALEYEVEIKFASRGIPRAQRKEIISEFGHELIARLFALPLAKWSEVLRDIKVALDEKQILIYGADSRAQEIAERENIAGRIASTGADYLGVFDANLFALKTDPYVPRAIFYRVARERTGLMGYAEIVYRYPVSGPFWKTKGYRSWTRVYVPKESVLVEATGAMEEELSKNLGNVEVSVEADKTVFGAFVAVQVGEVKRLSFKYRLPEAVENLVRQGRYELYVQKQPGTIGHSLTVSTDFGTMPTTWSPTGLGVSREGSKITWQTNLRKDQMFQVEF